MKCVLPRVIVGMLVLKGTASSGAVDFVREVRPIFEKHCISCHGAQKQKGGLRLDVKSAALKGGEDHGPGIVPGKPKESPVVRAVRGEDEDLKMPPKERLSPGEIGVLARWIEEGAVWPDGIDAAQVADPKRHWSFQPMVKAAPPVPKRASWARNALDRFVLDRLEREGLGPAPEALRSVWLRRVSYDLTGLPPSPEQRVAFENDKRPDAYERVVEQLLASPRYGEHWAQHWLDVVRYADTHGFEVNTERPSAWPYRDYVIRAMNADTPYDRFVREQLAGDQLGQDAATGFLVTASVLLPGQIGADDASKRLARQDSLDEIVVNTSQTFLGLSVGCARCHNHKFDPVTARDYYSMQAFFAGVEYRDREMRTPEADEARRKAAELRKVIADLEKRLGGLVPLAQSGAQRPAVDAKINVDRFTPVHTKRVRFSIESTNSLEPCVDELEIFTVDGVNVALADRGATVTASGQIVVADRHELRFLNDGKYGNSRSWMSNERGRGWVIVEFSQEQLIERVVWGRDREGKFKDRLALQYRIEVEESEGVWRLVADARDRKVESNEKGPKKEAPVFDGAGLSAEDQKKGKAWLSEKQKLETQLKLAERASLVFAGVFRTPDVIRVLYRGNPEQPQEEVVAAVPEALGSLRMESGVKEEARRMGLAEWIVRPENPLTARVMVNRVWQWHFGTGLVDTPSDFGLMGSKPTHPELLDWLAHEFVQEGWSLKKLHRLIVLSSTYRQSGQFNAGAAAKDAESRLLWRFPTRRLEAENIRDSMLAVSGGLNEAMYGVGFNLFHQRGGLAGFTPVEVLEAGNRRRMVYSHKIRREPDAVFGAFDCPDAGLSTSRRRESMTPIQALNLFNSRFALQVAKDFAARIQREGGDSSEGRIQRAFELALGRPANAQEVEEASASVRLDGGEGLCRALLNSNEFLFIP